MPEIFRIKLADHDSGFLNAGAANHEELLKLPKVARGQFLNLEWPMDGYSLT